MENSYINTKRVPITTTISETDYREAKAKNWALNEVFTLGMVAKRDNPQLIARITEQDDRIAKMGLIIEKQSRRTAVLEQKIRELGAEPPTEE